MKNKQLIFRLNWFYSLEINQVALYTTQSKSFKKGYLCDVFEHIADIEQQHADNIAVKIREFGGTPSRIGDVIAPISGSLGGKLISLAGIEKTLKINIALEQKAMKDYKKLMKLVKEDYPDTHLWQILQNNYIDEDLHLSWFSEFLFKHGLS